MISWVSVGFLTVVLASGCCPFKQGRWFFAFSDFNFDLDDTESDPDGNAEDEKSEATSQTAKTGQSEPEQAEPPVYKSASSSRQSQSPVFAQRHTRRRYTYHSLCLADVANKLTVTSSLVGAVTEIIT